MNRQMGVNGDIADLVGHLVADAEIEQLREDIQSISISIRCVVAQHPGTVGPDSQTTSFPLQGHTASKGNQKVIPPERSTEKVMKSW